MRVEVLRVGAFCRRLDLPVRRVQPGYSGPFRSADGSGNNAEFPFMGQGGRGYSMYVCVMSGEHSSLSALHACAEHVL